MRYWLVIPLLLFLATAAFGQESQHPTIEELQQKLKDKEGEIRALRAQIEVLRRNHAAQPTPTAVEEAELSRALERALVREGGLLLPFKTFEIEPNFIYSHTSQSTT